MISTWLEILPSWMHYSPEKRLKIDLKGESTLSKDLWTTL